METDYLVKGGYCNGTLEESVPDPDVTGWGVRFRLKIALDL